MGKKAFTIIELMVAIIIIIIITIASAKLLSPKIGDKQKMEIFLNKIISKIDTAKNYSLVGKGVGATLETPKYWKITFLTGSLGNQVKGFINTGSIEVPYNDLNMYFDNNYSITRIACTNIDGTNSSNTGSISLIIKGSEMSLLGCSDTKQKKANIYFRFAGTFNSISINTINSVISKN